MNMRDIFKALFSSWVGRVGAGFLAFMVIISFYVIIVYPLDFGSRIWNNPAYWADYPQNVPPAWSNWFTKDDQAVHQPFVAENPTRTVEDGDNRYLVYQFIYDFEYDTFPAFMSFSLADLRFISKSPLVTLTFVRPDGQEVILLRHVVPGPSAGETSPFQRYSETPFRIYLTGDRNVANNVRDFANATYGLGLALPQVEGQIERILFGVPDESGEFQPLAGTYEIRVVAQTFTVGDSIGEVRYTVGGTVYGLMGTDSNGRDLATGLLFGFPVALLIGVVTSIFITIIGTAGGIVSGYVGGKTDTLIQRLCDVLANIPLLPILIFLAFVFGQKLWLVMLVLVIFGWPGLTIIVRSMVLHQSATQLVESTRSLGAGPSRIMFRHILFQIGPFVLAQMIFATPGAILAEAGLSFLGLGDPSIPTWGQILESGFSTGAVYVGYWWWVLPPGLLVIFAAATFVLLSLGFEPVVNPKLGKNAAT